MKHYYKINAEELFNLMPGHFYAYTVEKGIIIACNKEQANYLGYSKIEDAIGKSLYANLVPEEAELLKRHNRKVLESNKANIFEEFSVTKNEKRVCYLSHKRPFSVGDRTIGIIGISLEITKEEEERFKRESILKNLMDKIPSHIYWKDVNGFFLGCNINQSKSLGLDNPELIVGLTAYDTLPKSQADEVTAIDKKVMQNDITITTQEVANISTGEERKYISQKIPLHNKDGEVDGVMGISIDISDQIKLEQERSEKELFQKQLKISETTGAGIAHELRTPLMTILNYTKAIELDIDANPKLIIDSVRAIKEEVNKSNELINIMLTNTQRNNQKNIELVELSIKFCIKEAINRFPYSDPEDRFLIKYDSSIDFIFLGNERLMIGVFFNLIKNAIYSIYKASKGGITISYTSDSEHNILTFTDTGLGIRDIDKSKIFRTFYSTTSVGSGVGLSFCEFAIRTFGGKIHCESVFGEYASFVIYLPKIHGVN